MFNTELLDPVQALYEYDASGGGLPASTPVVTVLNGEVLEAGPAKLAFHMKGPQKQSAGTRTFLGPH
jgi:hypothetical protein